MTLNTLKPTLRAPLFGATLALGALAAAGLVAEQAPLDADSDGLVTLAELQAALPEISEEVFVAADMDSSGALDEEEIARAIEMGLLPDSA